MTKSTFCMSELLHACIDSDGACRHQDLCCKVHNNIIITTTIIMHVPACTVTCSSTRGLHSEVARGFGRCFFSFNELRRSLATRSRSMIARSSRTAISSNTASSAALSAVLILPVSAYSENNQWFGIMMADCELTAALA